MMVVGRGMTSERPRPSRLTTAEGPDGLGPSSTLRVRDTVSRGTECDAGVEDSGDLDLVRRMRALRERFRHMSA